MEGPRRIVISGGSGFVGGHCARLLADAGDSLRILDRRPPPPESGAEFFEAEMGSGSLAGACQGIDAVLHLAALTHVNKAPTPEICEAYDRVNVQGTRDLVEEAAQSGVKRFVFLSSVKVNGEDSSHCPDRMYRESDAPAPEDIYGRTKAKAEEVVWENAHRFPMGAVVLRPCLVYGPGVPANFEKLIRLVRKRLPLPLASVKNRRSFTYVGDIAELASHCLSHPAAAGEVFFVADAQPQTTAELVRRIAAGLKIDPRLTHAPPQMLWGLARLAGRTQQAASLMGDLAVDASKAPRLLGWQPSASREQAMQATIDAFLARNP